MTESARALSEITAAAGSPIPLDLLAEFSEVGEDVEELFELGKLKFYH